MSRPTNGQAADDNDGTLDRIRAEVFGPPARDKGTEGERPSQRSHPLSANGPLVPRSPGSPCPRGGEGRSDPERVDFTPAHDVLERLWGAGPDGSMPCPLPGHSGSARLVVPENDHDRDLRLWCCRGRWRSLGETRAAIAFGTDDGGRAYDKGGKSNRQLAIWTRRLAYEVGVFAPLSVPLPPLPPDAPESEVRTREGFALLVGIRWADGPVGPVGFSVRFAEAWCGLPSRRAASTAIAALVDRGVLLSAGEDEEGPRHFGRGLRLYLPGSPPPEEAPRTLVETLAEEDADAEADALVALFVREFDAVEITDCGPANRMQARRHRRRLRAVPDVARGVVA